MSTIDVENTNLKQLAKRLVDDIRRRGLRPGDRYLTASEAGKQFDASEITIHRTMQLLADRDYLVRQRGSGTFVGSKFKSKHDDQCPLRVVHVVMSMDYQRTATVPAEILIDRLGISMPDAVVELHYVTVYDAMRHLDRIVERIRDDDRASEGIILIRSTRQMQLFAENCGLPAVVFGGVYPGVTCLPWLDIDQEAVGQTMARYVLANKPKRLLLLMRDDWRPGDNLLYQGVSDVLGKAGLSSDVLRVISIPPESSHIEQVLKEVRAKERSISGIMCRTHLYADVAARLVDSTGEQRRSVRIIAGGGRKPATISYAYVAPNIEEEKQVEFVGQMLLDRALQRQQTAQMRVIGVDLVEEPRH
ncbi:MAG: GntR family transcriptional regulator [Phycisphaeraceae bacterium]|nr:GntR family transcriptional regulator [Phycisphaeraceae bacterium]